MQPQGAAWQAGEQALLSLHSQGAASFISPLEARFFPIPTRMGREHARWQNGFVVPLR